MYGLVAIENQLVFANILERAQGVRCRTVVPRKRLIKMITTPRIT